ncbi:MAG: twitching motility protein PilT [Candidatus Delongbacteria bacterium GWF2_40_14]|nr:MAG: twitching motility protein PilT [Candidatus Delongbacteria bacterium GWF2_40_14]
MMAVLADTSVWIDYFQGGENSGLMDQLIDENITVTNDIILAELLPYLMLKQQNKVIYLLKEISKIELKPDWNEIIEIQHKCLQNGINGIGIPDLIIAQNAKQNGAQLYTLEKHFGLLTEIAGIEIIKD